MFVYEKEDSSAMKTPAIIPGSVQGEGAFYMYGDHPNLPVKWIIITFK